MPILPPAVEVAHDATHCAADVGGGALYMIDHLGVVDQVIVVAEHERLILTFNLLGRRLLTRAAQPPHEKLRSASSGSAPSSVASPKTISDRLFYLQRCRRCPSVTPSF